MTDKNLTEIVAVIDRSGSMASLKSDTIGGFNSFISEQRKEEGKALLTLIQFDDKYQIDYEGCDINDVIDLDDTTYVPRGSTALNDALGKAINTVGERLANLEEDKRPGQIIFLVITDGHENSSREFRIDQLKDMVKVQTDEFNWQFVYLGGGDLEQQGLDLGFSANSTYKYAANKGGTKALYQNISAGVTRSRQARAAGVVLNSADPFLDEDEVKSMNSESSSETQS